MAKIVNVLWQINPLWGGKKAFKILLGNLETEKYLIQLKILKSVKK
jgi:hypothetical protein